MNPVAIVLALIFAANSVALAQSTFTNTVVAGWGTAANWNPNGIPNAIDAVVTSGSATLLTSNTAENVAASGAFPYKFGTLNGPASGTVGTIGGNNSTNQLRAQVSTGTPTINISQGTMGFLSVLYGNQGYTKMGAGNFQLRFNAMTQQFTGAVYIAEGAVELQQDYSLGYATNGVVISANAALVAGNSTAGQSNTTTILPARSIILNAPGGAARISWHATLFTNVIQCVISESAANSGLEIKRAVTQFAGTTGTTMLCNTNTYTGPTTVTEGVLILSNQNAIAYSTLTPSGGTVQFHSGITANAFNVGGLAGTTALNLANTAGSAIVLNVGSNNANTVYSGALTGAGSLLKVGTGILDLQGTGNNTAGLVTVSNGVVILDKTSTASVHAINNSLTLTGGTAQLSGSGGDQIANANSVTINSGVFDLNGQSETIGGLKGSGGTNADSTLGANATLTIGVATGTSVTNTSAINGGNFIISGPGTQVFAGTDNRDAFVSGLTNAITGGTLQLGTGGAVTPFGGSEGIAIFSAGTLALNGTGTFTNSLSGAGTLAINSPGTVTVASVDTHTGNTLVNLGTLAVPSGGATVGGSVINVASNANFNVSPGAGAFVLGSGQTLKGAGTVTGNYSVASGATNAGTLTYVGNITLQAGAVVNPGSPTAAGTITNSGNIINSGSYQLLAYLAPTTTLGGGTNSLLVVTGNLNVGSGANAAKVVINGAPGLGTYVLATFGTFSGTVADVTATGPSGLQTYTVQTNGNQLQLVVGGLGAQNLVWRGDGTANVWDANNSANKDWFNTGFSTADYFASGDIVTFDNSSTNYTVTLTGTLTPQLNSVVTVGSTNNFTFSGNGALDGSITLTKTNSGTLTLQTTNTFTGAVNLNGGVVSVASVAASGTASPLGAGTTIAFNGGTLQYTGPSANTFNRTVTIGDSGATVDQSGTGNLFLAGAISGSGTLTKMGTNQLVVSGNNTGYTNATYVQNGQLQLNNVNALGNGSSMVFVTNSGASVSVGGGVTGTIVKPLTLAGDGDTNGALQAFSAATFSGAITLATNASIGGTASNTISGIIGGGGTLTKLGAGTHVLTANNTYTGNTVISAGTLQLGNGIGTNGWYGPVPTGMTLTNNSCLAFNHSNSVAVTDSISGTGWLNQIGTGLLTLGASNNFTGGNAFGHPSIGFTFIGALQVLGPVLVTNSYALGTVGAETGGSTASRLQLAGNISIPAPISAWSGALGALDIENVSGTNSVDQIIGIFGNNYWPITSTAGMLNINVFSNAIFNSTFGRTLELQGAANGTLTNAVDPSFFWLQIQKDGAGTWSLEGSIEAPLGLIVNAGTLVLDGSVNSLLRNQTISHTVLGGTLVVNGYLPVGSTSGNVAVNSGQLGGVGHIGGGVTVAAPAIVSPSVRNGTNTSLLTIDGNITFAGNLTINLNESLVQSNDVMSVGGSPINSGSGLVTLTNNGPALVAGDSFGIFIQSGGPLAVVNGTALNINRVVRGSVGQYVTWSNNLAVDGSIQVLAVAPLGTNAGLLSLALNPTDNLSPAFATNVFVYNATNAFGVKPTVTVTNSDLTASNALIVNGVFSQVLTSGVPSQVVNNLGVGSTNVLKVIVTAQDTVTTNLFTINLTQLPGSTNAFLTSLALNPTDSLTPNFATNVFAYFATNANGINPTVTVTNSDLTASNLLIVNGLSFQVLTSGVPSLAITNLGAGSTNILKVLVTAQNRVNTNLYTVNLTQLVSTVNTNTFTIGSSVSGGNLNLTWPPDRLGWQLWVQTNSLSSGLGTNWFAWPSSTTVTNVSIPINPANPTVFFRMTYP